MPQTFCSPANRSLGHLMPSLTPAIFSAARLEASAASMVYQDKDWAGKPAPGATRTLRVSEDPSGVTHSRPSRPLPACWCSVKYTLRCPASPVLARCASSVLVEPEVFL